MHSNAILTEPHDIDSLVSFDTLVMTLSSERSYIIHECSIMNASPIIKVVIRHSNLFLTRF